MAFLNIFKQIRIPIDYVYFQCLKQLQNKRSKSDVSFIQKSFIAINGFKQKLQSVCSFHTAATYSKLWRSFIEIL